MQTSPIFHFTVKINESLKEDLRRKLNTPGKQTGHAANQEVGADDAITRIETGNVLSILHSSGLLIDSGVKEEVHRILSGGNPSLLEGLSVAIKHTTVAQCMQRESSWAVLDVVDTLRGFTMAVHRAKEDRFGHRYRFPETHPALGSYRLAEALADVVRIMLDNYARRKDSIFVDVTTGLGLSSLNAAHSGYNTLMINGHKVHTAMVRVSACLQNISITQSDETIQYHTARPQGSLIPVVSGIGPTRRACGVLYDLDDFSDVRLSCNSDSQHHLSAAVWDATGHKRILQGKENVNTLDSQLGDRSVSVLKVLQSLQEKCLASNLESCFQTMFIVKRI
ncbi:hypothetical protein SARC_04875 [Sphaeroforma arctica JP610]|uniref:Uncharacterized protein n=1 Tax=Sphaeroforma arctica JP610 TaxID=667725 RepID=A0A0L0G1Z3_9EUKA|nr:hypothetical protein SARC_04875 [Sphaeroforma arctica JP610]KNC82851.1 hypothetical protein SARC_04875 [Sphaeroforma arctica JP610]|eukprot:XP_014156753.1 hypothetical protein SARC_04875 [Sphaeroforma arctica JP610]